MKDTLYIHFLSKNTFYDKIDFYFDMGISILAGIY